jgi:hypothetical protein
VPDAASSSPAGASRPWAGSAARTSAAGAATSFVAAWVVRTAGAAQSWLPGRTAPPGPQWTARPQLPWQPVFLGRPTLAGRTPPPGPERTAPAGMKRRIRLLLWTPT